MKCLTWILLFFAGVSFSLAFFNLYQAFSHPLKYQAEISTYSKEFNLSQDLVASVINTESGFNRNAKSNKGAIGLMQLKLTTANYICEIRGENTIDESELYKPEINIKFGCAYINYLMEKFENIETALAAYNAGETIVRTWLNDGIHSTDKKTLSYIPYEETRNYVEKVNKNIKYYSRIFQPL